MTQPEITFKKFASAFTATKEAIDDTLPSFRQMLESLREQQRAFDALPPQEQARILIERKERYEREKAERSCKECGCDPDEHGGY